MIEYKTGDILTEDAEALVNTVNCVGIMGRGVALQVKHAYPANFKASEVACKRGDVKPGRMFTFETGWLANPRLIINFPTKRHWRAKSRMEDIDAGLKALAEEIRVRHVRSIAIPPLGSGLGGLNWADVRPRIELALGSIEGLRLVIYEPSVTSDAGGMVASPEVPRMTTGRAALVVLIDRYLGGLMDPFVSLLEIHKLMYFMQEAGEPLNLRYAKAPYGPYAENLRHVLRAVEGHLLSGYADGGDAPDKQIALVPGVVPDAEACLEGHSVTRDRFDRVAGLVDGFETPFGLELLSTVHWVVTREDAASPEQVVNGTYAWGDRKRQFSPQQIRLALNVLAERSWVPRSLSSG